MDADTTYLHWLESLVAGDDHAEAVELAEELRERIAAGDAPASFSAPCFGAGRRDRFEAWCALNLDDINTHELAEAA